MVEKLNVNESNRWNYTLKNGKALRRAIENEDNVEVLNLLKKCYEEINNFLPDDLYDENDLYNDISEIDNQLDNCENYADYDMTYEDVTDEIDYLLQNFYDLCDANKIWVEL